MAKDEKKPNTLKITGRIIDRATKNGTPGLRVEAWDKDLAVKEAIGSAVTDAKGSFQIELDEANFRKVFRGRKPQLFFKVFQDGRLIQSTENSVLWSEERAATEIVIEGGVDPPKTEPERREVIGKVLFADGSPAAAIGVTLFNRDLRQEQQLGQGHTDEQGRYQLNYTNNQKRTTKAESTALVVKAFSGSGSLLAASQPLFDPPTTAEIDLTIPAEVQAPPPLFEKIGNAIAPLLENVKLEDLNEDEKHRDVSFLAGRTGFEKTDVARYAIAHKLAQKLAPAEFWFALLGGSFFQFVENKSLDHQLKRTTDSLDMLDAAAVRKALGRAVNQNEIAKTFSAQTDSLVESFLQFVASEAVAKNAQPSFLKSAVEHAIKDSKKQEKFARLFNEHKALTPELLTALESDKSFKKEEVADLAASFRLAELTQADFSVVKTIKEKFGIRQPGDIRKLAKKSATEWVELVRPKLASGEIKLPAPMREVTGEVKPPDVEIFGKTLERQFREAFPTTAFAGGLERATRNSGTRGLKRAKDLQRFLENHDDFEFLHTSVDQYLKNNARPDSRKLAQDEGFIQELKSAQRVLKLTQTFEATDALLADGLHSARHIYALGESQFVQRYGTVEARANDSGNNAATGSAISGLDASSARGVWNRAADTHAAALTIIADLRALDPNSLPQALQTGSQALENFPNWEKLFQTGDLCDCKACRSVLSPAAYFADLLMYLKDRRAANQTSSVKDILFNRRDDLGKLELNCENALTPLPYIDIVNEVMEAAIAADENDVELIGLTSIPDDSPATKNTVASILQAANLTPGDFSLSQVNPLHFDRWVVHGESATYLLKKKNTANFWAEVLRNTKAKADELRASPQYVNPKAYQKLRQAKYPMALPFDLFGEEVRATMRKSDLQRWELMETFRGSQIPNNPTDGEIAAEYFGISVDNAALRFNGVMTLAQKNTLLNHSSLAAVIGLVPYQHAIEELFQKSGRVAVTGLPPGFTVPATITGPPNNIPISYEPFRFDEKGLILVDDSTTSGQQTVWGETGNGNWLDATGNDPESLCIVKNFLQKTGLEYNELLALLDLEFINQAGDISVYHLDESCDTARKVIAVLDEIKLDRIHRFLRLWRKLKDWKMWELDLVLRHPKIGLGALDEPFLIKLFHFDRLKKRLGKKATVEQVCALFGDLNTETRFTKLHEPREDAVYQQLFLNRKLTDPIDPAFKLDPNTGDVTAGETIAQHRPVVAAALGLREPDLIVLEALEKAPNQDYIDGALSLANLSFLWRHAWLAKLLKFKTEEWRLVLKLGNQDVTSFADPETAWEFVEQVDQIKRSGFTPDELNWLLAADRQAKAAVKETDAVRFLSTLRNALKQIAAENDPSQYAFLSTPTDEGQLISLLTTLLQKLNRDEAGISYFLAALRGSVALETKVLNLPANFAFPAAVITAPSHIPIHYDEPNLAIRFNGLMTNTQRTMLLDETKPALTTLRATGHLETAVTGIPAGFVFPSTLNIPVHYDEPNLAMRFNGLMTDAQRAILLDETLPALTTLRATGQVEKIVPGVPAGFVFPSSLNIPIHYDEPNLTIRFNGLMTDAQRTTLLSDSSLSTVTANPDYQAAIAEFHQESVNTVAAYQSAIQALYQQSVIAITSYQAAIAELFQLSLDAIKTFAVTQLGVSLPNGLALPVTRPSLPINYDQTSQRLSFIGVMTDAERLDLINEGNPQPPIDELFQQPRMALRFFEPVFAAPLGNLPPAIDFKSQLSADLSAKISYDAEQGILRFAGIMSAAEGTALDAMVPVLPAEAAYHNAIASLFSQPQTIAVSDQRVWLTDNDLNPALPANDTLAKRLANAVTKALNYLSKTLAVEAVIQQSSVQLKLTEAMTRLLLAQYKSVPGSPSNKTLLAHLTEDFGVTTQVVDYLDPLLTPTFDCWFWATRVAAIWKKWKMTLGEWKQIIAIRIGAKLLDPLTLPLKSSLPIAPLSRFLRTVRLLRLRDDLPETNMTLLGLLEELNAAIPTQIANLNQLASSSFPANVEQLNEAWSKAAVETLVKLLDITNPVDYLLPTTWERLRRLFYFLDTLAAAPETAKAFAAPVMSDVDARTIRELLRSKFGTETWLTLSTEIQDVLRERKRDALAAFLLTQSPPNPPTQKWENTNDLYAYYLLDVEMSSCQLTSRLVQASGSVQLFVQRCFMGLEPDVEVKADGATGDSAWRWWKWMRKYRVWEANRKVFLWPENWIEPELKSDRSEFFKELENELLQNDINEPNVETAFAKYLEKLDGVAQLEIAGFYQQDDGDNAIVHVFGRTKGAEPHLYYYRRFDYRQWTPWEKVDLEIHGDHLIPAVVNNELFLFWPVFTEVPDDAGNSTVSTPSANQSNVVLQKTKKNLRLQLAVSEYRDGAWTPKRISDDFDVSTWGEGEISKKLYRFFPIDRTDIDGRFGIKYQGYGGIDSKGSIQATLLGAFEIAGCKGVPELATMPGFFKPALRPEYDSVGTNPLFDKWLELGSGAPRHDAPQNDFSLETYVVSQTALRRLLNETPWLFKMTPPWQLSYFDKLVLSGLVGQGLDTSDRFLTPMGSWLPFFYDDKKRTFFVLPSPSRYVLNAGDAKRPRQYYPDIKNMFREQEDFFAGEVERWLRGFEPRSLPANQRAQIEVFLQQQLTEERTPPYTDAQFKELLKRYFMRSFHWYLGTEALNLFQFSQFHFKNFYHPFVCDFAKKVYDPLKGIADLMSRETQLQDSGFSFRQSYVPTSLVVNPPTETFYPKEVVDFTPDGAYSCYNWELFFHAPLLIANALSKNQQFEEAQRWYHYIFNPIGVESLVAGGSAMSKYWITKPFFLTTDPQYLQQRIDHMLQMLAGGGNQDLENQVVDSRNFPFDPHRIANYRNVAYQKNVVMKYLDNLIAWGDFLFRQDSMESINEATQIYVLAAELLGPRPKNIPPAAKVPVETFNELENQFDKFSNALVEVENLVPPLVGNGNAGNAPPLPMLYFCIPHNEKMLGYWNTIADRLYKIRHCMNIEGVVRQLALFEPPIDPGALVKAVAAGVDISSALAEMNVALPLYHFNVWVQKANEVCNDVKALGGALLAALEKKDAEALGLLRQEQEARLLEAVKAVRKQQIEEAKENLEGIRKGKESAQLRKKYYESREFMNPSEIVAISLSKASTAIDTGMAVGYLLAGGLKAIPQFILGAAGFGGTPHATAETGGTTFGEITASAMQSLGAISHSLDKIASIANTMGSYQRRRDEWEFQRDLAAREIAQADKSIAAAELRVAIAEKELATHLIQIENAKAIEAFMRSKYTNLELYQWQVGQISTVYFQSYKLAYDLAKRAERCFRFELGLQDSSYISFGYWDSLKKGLLSGDKLQYDLRRLETSYLDQNRREFELTKHISLALLNPLALIKLRETGRCFFQLPESLFDLDFPGHYFRRITSVSLTLPCITGPYTTISCTLRLLNNSIRINTDIQNGYARNEEDGLPADDSRFVENKIAVKAIAASSAQNDSGLFELNFRDERYLPFEGGGAVSTWSLELFTDSSEDFGAPLRQFDYTTITDAILHLRYTSREDAGQFKHEAIESLRTGLANANRPSLRMLDLRQEFPSQWHRFLTPNVPGGANVFEFELSPNLFPFRDTGKSLTITSVSFLARCTGTGNYEVTLTLPASATFSLAPVAQYGGLHFGQQSIPIDLESDDPPTLWKFTMTGPGGGVLTEDAVKRVMEVEQLVLVLGYAWK
jgi:hypothetical protein